MDMTGERRIVAPRQIVWEALNDTTTLKASIPGCESLEKVGDNQMKAVAAVRLGPISARFNGAVTLSDIDAPNSYTITGEGQGGVAGFAKGGAKVVLTDDAGATLLKYEVNAQVGGKLAQLGARLIDATAKQMAEQFFTKFSDEVQKLVPPEPAPPPVPVATLDAGSATSLPEAMPPAVAPPSAISPFALVPREAFGLPVIAWLGIAAFVVMAVLWLASML
jgi:carbon monoxide dehydrogenase subunit G